MISLERLEQVLGACLEMRIGLVGDLFLDRYLDLDGDAHELSLETGLEAYQVRRVRNAPGALGTVLSNLDALGAGHLTPVTVIGHDGHGHDLLRELSRLSSVDDTYIVRSPDQLTPTYTKPLMPEREGGRRELNRLDVRSRRPLPDKIQDVVCEHVRRVFEQCDGMIVLDQVCEPEWGVVGRRVRDLLSQLVAENPHKLVLVDSRNQLKQFSCGVLKGNCDEMLKGAGIEPNGRSDDETALRQALGQLVARTGRPVFCTVGQRGMLVAVPDRPPQLISGYPRTGLVDIVGAGDSATSGIAASLLAGVDAVEAADVGNLAASVTVQQIGRTGTASPDQIRARWRETR